MSVRTRSSNTWLRFSENGFSSTSCLVAHSGFWLLVSVTCLLVPVLHCPPSRSESFVSFLSCQSPPSRLSSPASNKSSLEAQPSDQKAAFLRSFHCSTQNQPTLSISQRHLASVVESLEMRNGANGSQTCCKDLRVVSARSRRCSWPNHIHCAIAVAVARRRTTARCVLEARTLESRSVPSHVSRSRANGSVAISLVFWKPELRPTPSPCAILRFLCAFLDILGNSIYLYFFLLMSRCYVLL